MSKSETLSFDKLHLESIVVEFRYSFAYVFWDRVGSISNEIKKQLPPAPMELGGNAKPGLVTLSYDRQYDISLEPTQLSVAFAGAKTEIKEFLKIASVIFEITVKALEIDVFERVGMRQIFVKKYANLKKANEAISQIPALAMIKRPLEGHKNAEISPSALVRMDLEATGTTFSLKAVERDFQMTAPPVFWDSSNETSRSLNFHHAIFAMDIDAYTRRQVSVDQFDLTEWVRQQSETVKRDSAMFF